MTALNIDPQAPYRNIKAIAGQEPQRENEYPLYYQVGQQSYFAGKPLYVLAITHRNENYGTYGLGWYDIITEEGLSASLNAMFIALVIYGAPESSELEKQPTDAT